MQQQFYKTNGPAPVLNTPLWKGVFCDPMPLDSQRLLRCVETVLFKGSLVEVVESCGDHIVKVRTAEYPGSELYMDDRFLEPAKDCLERKRKCPSLEEFLAKLKAWPKAMYVWGGNYTRGIPQIAEYYPMPKKVDPFVKKVWTFKGVDCSGLLYEATDGFLPRNTSQLVDVGIGVPIENKTPKEIAKLLLPGDLIVWKGHVIIVEDKDTVFESAPHLGGTARSALISRLESIGSPFAVRRWC